MRPILVRCLAVVSLLAAACHSPTEGGNELPNLDTYQLRSIAGISLPAPYAPNQALANRMISAWLRLDDDGTGHWHAVAELEPGGSTFEDDEDLNYTRSGDDVSIWLICNDIADCIPGPHFVGSLTETGLTITTSVVTREPLVFELVHGAIPRWEPD
jgi:hypothetical protein